MTVVGCVDDGLSEKRIDGVRLLGRIDDLPQIVPKQRIDLVIVAITGAPLSLVNRVKQICVSLPDGRRPSVKVVPDAGELLSDRVTVSRMRDIRLEEVLNRDPVVIDTAAVRPHLEKQVVLVTGVDRK